MRSLSCLLLLALLASLALVAACQPGPKASKDGALLFDTSCAQCHGHDGKGAPAFKALGVPDFTDPAVQARFTDAQAMETVQNGSKSRKMPPWRGIYSDEQIRLLVAHVRSFAAPK